MTLRWCEECWEPVELRAWPYHWHTNSFSYNPEYYQAGFAARLDRWWNQLDTITSWLNPFLVDDESHIVRSEN